MNRLPPLLMEHRPQLAELCRRFGVRVSMWWFGFTGLGLACTAVLASVGALLLTSG